ncbi:hypothetical protein BON30_34160 [Cystobacter ferrugineus]|uniref:Uncharacterized protein n=1 Tax=Cystobacter ferrugineus TaxID=83449 RepID=A0A1L9B1W6_9BACT|nr:hypothetical protein BON30_34160 [Cystobacter ferrugineus]
MLPPLAAFVLARGLLFIAAFKAGQVPWLAGAWVRWDSGHYLSLAANGFMLGFVAALAVFQVQTGAWNALFLSQAKYGHGIGNPLETLDAVVGPLLRGESRHWKNASPRVQTLLVALLVLVARPLSRWREVGQRERGLALYGLAFWLFPLVMGRGVSLYRSESLLVPLVLLAWRPAVGGRVARARRGAGGPHGSAVLPGHPRLSPGAPP